ncbi:hypothetical protein ACFS32_10925 [Novosphingobium pokkalii]|uniref:hypothetical protein n=1 Tax=Novosphingobium pokkalii TaxID=1770194 RepID=UPI00363FD8A2
MAVAGVLIAAWTGFFLWAAVPGLIAVHSAAAWAAASGQWAAPVLVVLVTLLLVQRGSGREARRFASIASGLSRDRCSFTSGWARSTPNWPSPAISSPRRPAISMRWGAWPLIASPPTRKTCAG